MVLAFEEIESQFKQNKLLKDACFFTVKNPSTSNVLRVTYGRLMECMIMVLRHVGVPNDKRSKQAFFFMVHQHGSDDMPSIVDI